MDDARAQLQELQLNDQHINDQVHENAAALHAPDEVNRISMKLPPFWKQKPLLWFSQVEAQFTLNRITSENTKFCYVISNLEQQYASEVEDLIVTPPLNMPYTTLKSELIRRLSVSEERRIKQLLLEEELGDRTPSQFLRCLRSLVGPTVIPDNLLQSVWMQRLPPHVQAILHK